MSSQIRIENERELERGVATESHHLGASGVRPIQTKDLEISPSTPDTPLNHEPSSHQESPDPARATGIERSIFLLAWPMALSLIADTCMGLVDTTLVGRLGKEALGGVGVAMMVMYLFYAVLYGVMRGVKIQTAYAVGRDEASSANLYAKAGLLLGSSYGLFVFALGRNPEFLFRPMGVSPNVMRHACDFFSTVTYGAPFVGIVAALVQFEQGRGNSKKPMKIQIGANILNAILAVLLIGGTAWHQRFGFQGLGVRGAGFATAIALAANAAVQLGLNWASIARGWTAASIHFRAIKEVLVVGIPTGAQFGCEMLAMTTFTALLGSISAAEVAANQVALMILRTSFLPGLAISEACSVLVGQALGRNNVREAEAVLRSSIKIALAYMLVAGIFLGGFGSILARLFTTDAEVAKIVSRLLWVALAFQLPDAFNLVYRGALRGAKDARVPAWIAIIATWCTVPPAAYFLGQKLGLGAVGGWIGFVGETLIAATLYRLRWKRGTWRERANRSMNVRSR